jgi:hypothetical protein
MELLKVPGVQLVHTAAPTAEMEPMTHCAQLEAPRFSTGFFAWE